MKLLLASLAIAGVTAQAYGFVEEEPIAMPLKLEAEEAVRRWKRPGGPRRRRQQDDGMVHIMPVYEDEVAAMDAGEADYYGDEEDYSYGDDEVEAAGFGRKLRRSIKKRVKRKLKRKIRRRVSPVRAAMYSQEEEFVQAQGLGKKLRPRRPRPPHKPPIKPPMPPIRHPMPMPRPYNPVMERMQADLRELQQLRQQEYALERELADLELERELEEEGVSAQGTSVGVGISIGSGGKVSWGAGVSKGGKGVNVGSGGVGVGKGPGGGKGPGNKNNGMK